MTFGSEHRNVITTFPSRSLKYVIERTAAECGVAEEFPGDEPCLLKSGLLRGELLANPIPVNLS